MKRTLFLLAILLALAISMPTDVQAKNSKLTGVSNDHEWVDLGLPSGIMWATCNIGASKPEEFGDYFAWGETTTKSNYSDSTSLRWGEGLASLKDKGVIRYYKSYDGTLTSEYDAACKKWGGKWRMPNLYEYLELLDNCKITWATVNGVDGCILKGSNGNSIFFPAAGKRKGSSLSDADSHGSYWCSTANDSIVNNFNFSNWHNSVSYSLVGDYMYYGLCIRPIFCPNNEILTTPPPFRWVSEGLGINSVDEALKGRVADGTSKQTSEGKVVLPGDIIKGIVRDSYGPMIAVNVVEIDKYDRIKALYVTDIKGEFSFCAVDPKNDIIMVPFVGYLPFLSPIDTNYFDIILAVDTAFKDEPIIINDDKILKDLDGLGITTIDEALNGRFGLDVPIPVENTVNPGDTIRGIVRDSNGPMMHVNVVEIDINDKVQAYALSDYNGKFSFRAVNPKKNKIQVSFVGYLTVSSPIDSTYFDIKMMDIHNDQVFEISVE